MCVCVCAYVCVYILHFNVFVMTVKLHKAAQQSLPFYFGTDLFEAIASSPSVVWHHNCSPQPETVPDISAEWYQLAAHSKGCV